MHLQTGSKKIFKIFSGFVLAVIFLAPLPVWTASAQSPIGEGNYIVKLRTLADYSKLLDNGSNVHRRFAFSRSSEFKAIYTFTSKKSLEELKLAFAGNFDYLETSRQLNIAAVAVNDPGFSVNGQDIDKEWGLIKPGFNQAWEKTTGSNANVVAVIDTGVDESHEDLKNITFVKGFNFLANQDILPGTNSDDNGHGTLVAGILGASVNNGLGIAGTNWQISVMPLKALDSSGKGEVADLSEAIVWAADNGAQFINLSVGGIGFGHDTALANAVSYAFNKNVLLVAAAGNDTAATGTSLDQSPVFPICDDNNFNMIIGVAATDQNDIKPEFSNYGRNCIDVAAPGKRILSTINIDPLTKKSAPNSYAYASGTSMAVPFVVGQAALIRSLFPFATNVQIRDRIISTADPIDGLNLSQCGGSSCRGLVGTGRINVPKSLETAINQNYAEGDLVKAQETGAIYQIVGGQKRLVSPFVYNQRFASALVKTLSSSQLSGLPEGSYITPNNGTLVKLDADPTVYFIENGQKLPVTALVFEQRKLNYASINTVSFSELNSWPSGSFFPPLEGSLIRTPKNRTVYWVVGKSLHPINYGFYMERGLNIFPVIYVSDAEVAGYAKGEAYIK